MRTCLSRVLIVAALLGAAGGAVAQPRRPPVMSGSEKRDELKKRIRVMRAYTLTEELALDEATTGKLFPLLAKYDELTDQLLVKRADLQRRLNSPPADPRAIDRLVDESISNQHALWDTQDKRLADLRRVLSPPQVARLLVVEPALERRLEGELRAAASGRGLGPMPGHRRGTPDSDKEDTSGPPVSPTGKGAPQPARPVNPYE